MLLKVAGYLHRQAKRVVRTAPIRRLVHITRLRSQGKCLYVDLPTDAEPSTQTVSHDALPGRRAGVTRIVAVSDTHAAEEYIRIPECDVLVHCGDALQGGRAKGANPFFAWLHNLLNTGVASSAICIGGNHDRPFEKWGQDKCEKRFAPAQWLQGSGATVEGWEVFGLPHSYASKSQNRAWQFHGEEADGALAGVWGTIPEGTEVLVTHCPPSGSKGGGSRPAKGCPDLARRVRDLPALRLHLFGHEHSAYGCTLHEGRASINCSSMAIPWLGLIPLPIRGPVVVDLQKE